jgi:DNA-binding NarL/FixJ family response regulator
MSGVSLPVTRPTGRALVVANPVGRAQPVEAMAALGFECVEADEPYAAMAELAQRPLAYRAMVLGLAGLYLEELELIRSVKRRYPHMDIWLTQTDGRQAGLAEAIRLGADGLLAEDGLHRIALAGSAMEPQPTPRGSAATTVTAQASQEAIAAGPSASDTEIEPMIGEPVLTADELRALLDEQPSFPQAGEE